MLDKKDLRYQLRKERKAVPDKAKKDNAILQRLQERNEFKNADLLLCYLSLSEEIDTDSLINLAWRLGKTVAVPYCVDRNGNMDFYVLKDFADLHIGNYGVREPDIFKTQKLRDYSRCVCIVPGIAFDGRGYRLGYGKGYYDRFLKKYSSISIGLCYNSLIQKELPVDGHDVPVNLVITENRIIGGKNG